MNLVMIAIHKKGNRITGFRITDTDSVGIKDVKKESMYKVLTTTSTEVENIKVEGDKLVGANGAFQRYPTLINGQLVGKSPLIILSELVDNKYRVANYMGEIVDMEINQIKQYSLTEGISNGRIVYDEEGQPSVSAISGTFKKDRLLINKSYGRKMVAKVTMMGNLSNLGYNISDKYCIKGNNPKAETIIVNKGILGLCDGAFKGFHSLREISIADTVEYIGKDAFNGCKSLEKINIPEGIKVIEPRSFYGCKSLKSIVLPNSIKVIKTGAFQKCDNLREISCGPGKIEVEFGAIPRGTRRVIRK